MRKAPRTSDTSTPPSLHNARQNTLAALEGIDNETLRNLTRLTLPEIEGIKTEIASILPAGNLPAFVLSGLVQLKERRVNSERVRQDINALLKGLNLLPQGLYGVFIAGPAAVLYGYQKLLQLAGKDIKSAFPQGTWQFYLEFGLREDSARHINETVGFHQALPDAADDVKMATVWVRASLELLFKYDDLLAVDWRERVLLRSIQEVLPETVLSDHPHLQTATREWARQRPYHRPADDVSYVEYRLETFTHFIEEQLAPLPPKFKRQIHEHYDASEREALSDYQAQLSILATLQPERYQERKIARPLWRALLGFVWQGHTYLLPVCQQDAQGSPLCQGDNGDTLPLYALPDDNLCDAQHHTVHVGRTGQVTYQDSGTYLGTLMPTSMERVQSWVKAIMTSSSPQADAPELDILLTQAPRRQQSALRAHLPQTTQAELQALQRASIIVNWDLRPHEQPLALIRRAHRGLGDHALTLFHTDRSIVFDQSHIFFDGMWGMAVAEILTDSAIHAYHRLENARPAATWPSSQAPKPLTLYASPAQETDIRAQGQAAEAAAESSAVDMEQLGRARHWLKQRGVRLTINDLLILARFIHATQYTPSANIQPLLEALRSKASTSTEHKAAWESVVNTLARFRETNPALLIPMDASNVSPHERLFPTTFRNPMTGIPQVLEEAKQHYLTYRADPIPENWAIFDQQRRELLAYLKAFGDLLDTLKAVTMRGESFNTATIRLLGHLPPSMQNLLDSIPQRIGMLNEIIKGSEVFSNVGRVAPGSTLRRFTSAKDDGKTKELVWGILTDDTDTLHVSLRDFREFVPLILAQGHADLAAALAQDYVDSYVDTLNRLMRDLSHLIVAKGPHK